MLASWINEKNQECATELNVKFSLQYDVQTKKFAFSFPSSESVSVLIVTEKPEFGLQMGFPFSHVIKKDYKSKEAGEIERNVNVSNAIDRCKAMCYDTGQVLCMLDQVSSNATSNYL